MNSFHSCNCSGSLSCPKNIIFKILEHETKMAVTESGEVEGGPPLVPAPKLAVSLGDHCASMETGCPRLGQTTSSDSSTRKQKQLGLWCCGLLFCDVQWGLLSHCREPSPHTWPLALSLGFPSAFLVPFNLSLLDYQSILPRSSP